ncbi:MAG: threonylcarbamoyl-AMP synthase [Bacteroidetes bacterium]|jgi:L-threonylcarbamoyladenylate synthase|nr:threonylcarbamoyl-AMP synthase [Bacteroidota bacterium]
MKNIIKQTIEILNSDCIFLYPTDTVYGIGCDATNEKAVSKIYNLKQRDDSKALICLVKDVKMLSQYVEYIPKKAHDYLGKSDRPTSIIYPKAKNLAKNLIADDGSIAIRICRTEYCQNVFKFFGKPVVSTSANISGTPTPQNFDDIQDEILKGVDYVVNLHDQSSETKPSRIIKFDDQGQVQIIRD